MALRESQAPHPLSTVTAEPTHAAPRRRLGSFTLVALSEEGTVTRGVTVRAGCVRMRFPLPAERRGLELLCARAGASPAMCSRGGGYRAPQRARYRRARTLRSAARARAGVRRTASIRSPSPPPHAPFARPRVPPHCRAACFYGLWHEAVDGDFEIAPPSRSTSTGRSSARSRERGLAGAERHPRRPRTPARSSRLARLSRGQGCCGAPRECRGLSTAVTSPARSSLIPEERR